MGIHFKFVLLIVLSGIFSSADAQTGSYSQIGEISRIGGSGFVSDAVVQDHYLMVGGYTYDPVSSYVKIYDISTPTTPVLLQTVTVGETYLRKLMLDTNGFLYALCEEKTAPGLYVYDLSTPAAPLLVAQHDCVDDGGTNRCFRPGYGVLDKRGEYLLVARSLWGFNLFNMTNLQAPVYQDGASYDFYTARDLFFLSDSEILFNDGSGLRTINYSNPTSIAISSTTGTDYVDLPGEVESMVLTADKKTAYLYSYGMTLSQISVVDIPTKTILTQTDISDISELGGQMHLSSDEKKLFLGSKEFDIANRSALTFVGYYDNQVPLHVNGNLLFLRYGNTTVRVMSSGTTASPGLSITGFSPVAGPAGTTVTLQGTNFSAEPSANVVKFNGVQATVTSATSGSITATVPPAATTGKITVTVDGVTVTSSGSFTVTASALPVITGFSPASGPIDTEVTITGMNFSATAAENIVAFNGTESIVLSSTSTSITTRVPEGATTGPVTVTIDGQTAESPTDFIVPLPAVPAIGSFYPISGIVGASVVITGTNFSATPSENIVTFNGVQAIVTSSTGTSITAQVPAGATTGLVAVTVNGESGTSAASFKVLESPPSFTSLAPDAGPAGAIVVVHGTNFSTTLNDNKVFFNSIVATILSCTSTTITVTVPDGATTGNVYVLTKGKLVGEGLPFTIEVPLIESLSPVSGPIGLRVTISGSNFSDPSVSTRVFFGETESVISEISDTGIETIVPEMPSFGKVSIRVQVGNSSSVGGTTFEVVDCVIPDKPEIEASHLDTEEPILTSTSGSGNQWFRNEVLISNATDDTFTVSEPGIYTVQVSDGGCFSEMSEDFVIIVTSTSPFESQEEEFYPNPAKDFLNLKFPTKSDYRVMIFKAGGDLVKQIHIQNGDAAALDVRGIDPGLYFVIIKNGRTVSSHKFVKD